MSEPVYLYVTPFFPSQDDWRGAYCYDFVVALKRTGRYRVEVFVPGAGDDYKIGCVTVHRFSTRQLPSNIFPFLWARWNKQSFIYAVKRAGINLTDVVVCHGHTANFAIYPLAIKSVNQSCLTLLHHHDLESFGLNLGGLRHCWLYNMIEFPILRRLHEKIDCHVFISEVSRRSFLSAPDTSWTTYDNYKKQMRWLPYRSVKIKRSLILHNGLDMEIFKPNMSASVAATSGKSFDAVVGCNGNFTKIKGQMSLSKTVKILREEGVIIGCVANIDGWKDQITLIIAIHKLRNNGMDVKGIFVGTGPELKVCKRYVFENGLQHSIFFMTEMRHEELPDFYRSIDLFVLPSYFEGFGCVFTEAWACGTPFITCEGQGMDDLIPNEERSLWLAKPCDADDLARKIHHYFEMRPTQHLTGAISFDELIPTFIEKVMAIAEANAAINEHLPKVKN